MSKKNVFIFFDTRFRGISRIEREKILCAMIRVNYGTPWTGDLEILKSFFPKWFQRNLVFGGLTELIEALSPSADEPTDPGIRMNGGSFSQTPVKADLPDEDTHTIGDITTDLPKPAHELTATLKDIPLE